MRREVNGVRQPFLDDGADIVTMGAFARALDVDISTAGRIVRRLGMRQYEDPCDRRKTMVSLREYARRSQPSPIPAGAHARVVPSPFRPLPAGSRLGWFEDAGGFNSPSVRFERAVLSQPPDTVDVPDVSSDVPGQRVGIMWDYLPHG